jgi:hypothetical protein
MGGLAEQQAFFNIAPVGSIYRGYRKKIARAHPPDASVLCLWQLLLRVLFLPSWIKEK